MNKIIFVEGIPGCGKSTTSQRIYEELIKNNIPCKWLHEGLVDHPLWQERDDFFNEDGYIEKKDFDLYTESLLKKIEKIIEDIHENNTTYVIDGHLLSSFSNVYYNADCDKDKILEYFSLLEEVLSSCNPLLLYLQTERVRAHSIETWESRAMWTKAMAIDYYGKAPRLKRSEIEGEDVIYEYINPLQNQNLEFYDLISFDKLKFIIDERKYDLYHKTIMDHLNLKVYDAIKDPSNYEEYVGIYDNDRDKKNIFVKIKEDKLVCDWGQLNMVLNYVETDVYSLRSYPIKLHFKRDNKKVVAIDTYGQQCYKRAGCHFDRVEESKHEIRK